MKFRDTMAYDNLTNNIENQPEFLKSKNECEDLGHIWIPKGIGLLLRLIISHSSCLELNSPQYLVKIVF